MANVPQASEERTPIDNPWWPDHLVVGWFGTKKDADAARRQVQTEVGDRSDIFILSGQAAAERLQNARQTQKSRNPFKRLMRVAWLWSFIDAVRFREIEDKGRQGGYMVVIQAKDDPTADEAARSLANCGGREVTRFSRNEGVDVVGPRHAS